MSVKEESELNLIKKASQVSVDIFNKYLKDQIMDIIDSDKVIILNSIFLKFQCAIFKSY